VLAGPHGGGAARHLPGVIERILEPGPIPYAETALFGDLDLEDAVRQDGLDSNATAYRSWNSNRPRLPTPRACRGL